MFSDSPSKLEQNCRAFRVAGAARSSTSTWLKSLPFISRCKAEHGSCLMVCRPRSLGSRRESGLPPCGDEIEKEARASRAVFRPASASLEGLLAGASASLTQQGIVRPRWELFLVRLSRFRHRSPAKSCPRCTRRRRTPGSRGPPLARPTSHPPAKSVVRTVQKRPANDRPNTIKARGACLESDARPMKYPTIADQQA